VAYALSPASPLGPGDTLYLRGGTYWETKLRTSKKGTAGAPIRIRNYPGEVPVIDGSAPAFRTVPNAAWEFVGPPNIYRTVAPQPVPLNPASSAGGFFVSGGQLYALIRYGRYEDLTNRSHYFSPDGYYAGPGAYYNPTDHRVYVRLDPPDPAVVGGTFGLTHNVDPRQTELYIAQLCDPECWGILFEDGASHQEWTGLQLVAHGVRAFLNSYVVSDLHFTDMTITTSGDGFLIRNQSHNITIDNLDFDGRMPPWIAWNDAKDGRSVAGSMVNGAVGIVDGVHHVTVRNSRIANVFDGIRPAGVGAQVAPGCEAPPSGYNVHDVQILDTDFINIRDDAVSLGADAYAIEIGDNRFVPVSKAVSKTGSGQTDQVGTVFIHHNIIDIEPLFQERATAPGDLPEMATHLAFGGHNMRCAGESPWKIYNNTIVVRGVPLNSNGLGHEYDGKWVQGTPGHWPEPHEVFNNILMMTTDTHIGRKARIGTGQEIYDGNLYWRGTAQPASELFFPLYYDLRPDTEVRIYPNLQSFRSNQPSARHNQCNACSVNWFAKTKDYYAPGWESSGLEANPQLAADYTPRAGSPAATGAIDLEAKGWPGYDGLDYRGALPPAE
jgi:hypothetical protein